MSDSLRTAVASLLLAWTLLGSVQAVVIATFPSNPELIIGYGENPNPLVIDFDGNGIGDVFMVGNGPSIDFHVTDGNRALVWRPPPPNLGGLLANIPAGFNITGLLDGVIYWYGGFPDPDVAELIGIPRNSNFVSFGQSNTSGESGNFINVSGYFGIEFKIEDTTHYGWVHITNETGLGHGGYIDGWAYETDAGVGIIAGAVPEPGVGVMFFVGAIGLMVRRRCSSR